MSDIVVDTARRVLTLGNLTCPCAIGAHGAVPAADKREGDGATPLGRFALRRVFYRPDRLARPDTGLPVSALAPETGWCDAPDDPNYNRLVRHPYPASAERLWRNDHAYDLIVVIGHNDDPVVPNLGSAIFLHVARLDDSGALLPTRGCVTTAAVALWGIVQSISAGDHISIRRGRAVMNST